jgi:alpha-beta hydrolase superfamily lysophospholipase
MEKKKTAVLIGAGTALGFSAAAAAASFMLYRQTLPRPKGTGREIIEAFTDSGKAEEYAVKMKTASDRLASRKMEDLFIPSNDGLRLHALYLPADRPAKKTVLFHHGFTGCAIDNGTHALFFHALGYDVILLDLRAHGLSEGRYVGFSILDRYDTLAWVRYVKERFGEDRRIVLHGTSMGAATVLMAQGQILPPNTAGIIADCGFTSPWDIAYSVVKQSMGILAKPLLFRANLFAKSIVGIDLKEKNTEKILAHAKIPTLFIHGEEDHFVWPQNSKENYLECGGPKELLMIEQAVHASSFCENPGLYQTFVQKLFNGEIR